MRARIDIVAVVVGRPSEVRILYRGATYSYELCPNCQQWYWRVQSPHSFRQCRSQRLKERTCSLLCQRERARMLTRRRQKRYQEKHPRLRKRSRP